jgi:alanine-glyoxylate transaminase/serine-glyoxylate transaminase/serine-pyruvate transaminase
MDDFQLSLPGPTECDPEVLQELARPNLPHYGEIWMGIYSRIVRRLKEISRASGSMYVIPGSGSAGLDAVFTSLGSQRGVLLNNGTFGNRIATIASRQLSHVKVIEKAPGEAFDLGEVEKALGAGDIDLLGVVHGETSTGMLNDLSPLSELCRTYNTLFVVDAVSTLGGVPLDVDALGIDFCVSASQKALGSLPGLAIVGVSQRGWAAMPPEDEIKSWYLNLRTWAAYEKEWSDWHPYPVTLPVHLLLCLDKALEIIQREGLEARWERHRRVSEELQGKLEQLGVGLFIGEKSSRLATVTAGVLPSGMESQDLQKHLRESFGILIAGGVGPLRKRIFRVGHMGYSAQIGLVNRVIAGIRDFVEQREAASSLEREIDVDK